MIISTFAVIQDNILLLKFSSFKTNFTSYEITQEVETGVVSIKLTFALAGFFV
ncbi:MAG: hypothetical protein LBQ24_00340 [Candidatus Peribacteria bacterium]|jgi:hypothetical protein|nr:hypothetical protein [Candidatus Peribacteria bacterium]